MYKIIPIKDLVWLNGCLVRIDEKYENEYVPKGLYKIKKKDEHEAIKLYKDGMFCYIEEYSIDDKVDVDTLSVEKRLENIIEAYIATCMSLIKDGWSDDETKHFNINPIMNQLRMYKKLESIIKGCE